MKWYQEKTFKAAVLFLLITGIFFTVYISIDEQEFAWGSVYFFGGGLVLVTVSTYIAYLIKRQRGW